MSETPTVNPDRSRPHCTKARIRRGELTDEWPLVLAWCLFTLVQSITLVIVAHGMLGIFGVLLFPVGFALIARGTRWLTRQVRYSETLRAVFLWPSFAILGIFWLTLSWHAGLAVQEELRDWRDRALDAEPERHAQAVRDWQRRPAWHRLVVPEPGKADFPSDTVIEAISLLVALASLLSPLGAFALVLRQETNNP